MGGGHSQDDALGAGGHDVAHGHAEIPPAPEVRSISPAREDYEQPWPGNLLLWPFVWLGVALLFVVAARTWSHPWIHEAHAEHPAGPAHAAPAEHAR
jgi:hypothetical protein